MWLRTALLKNELYRYPICGLVEACPVFALQAISIKIVGDGRNVYSCAGTDFLSAPMAALLR